MSKFSTGDVVKYVGKGKFWKKGDTHIISEVQYQGGGRFEYSTNRGAWFTSKDFTLVNKANKASFAELDKHLDGEDEDV